MRDILAVYGGTFSPPHRGHMSAARAFLAAVEPRELLIMPTCTPPHKQQADGATPEERAEMCRIAFRELPRTIVSDLELRRGGKSYTSDTLTALAARYGAIAWLVGSDMMLSLDTWHDSDTIFRLAELYCVRRESDAESAELLMQKNEYYKQKYGKCVYLLNAGVVDVSSTELRNALARGEESDMLDPAVLSYIRERGLYGFR